MGSEQNAMALHCYGPGGGEAMDMQCSVDLKVKFAMM